MDAPITARPVSLPQFSLNQALGTKNVVLFVQEQKGFGDLVNGYLLAEALVKRGNLDLKNIIIATNNKKDMDLFNEMNFKIIDKDQARNVHNVALQILVPGYGHYLKDIILSAPIVQFMEYGHTVLFVFWMPRNLAEFLKAWGYERKTLGFGLIPICLTKPQPKN